MKTLLKTLTVASFLAPIMAYVWIYLIFILVCMFALAFGAMTEETFETVNKFGVTIPLVPMVLIFIADIVHNYKQEQEKENMSQT